MDSLDPVGTDAAVARALAARPSGLGGLTIGILDNSKPNARVLLEEVARMLAERTGARGVRVWGKPGASQGAVPALLDEIAGGCGALLTASAD